MTVLDRLSAPVVLAPLGGGPSTPQLAAAVASAGGLGFLAAGYLTAAQLGERITEARSLTEGLLGVNLFVPEEGPADPESYRAFVERLQLWTRERDLPLGEARYSDDDWEAKVSLLLDARLPVVSFTFGCPQRRVIDALHGVGSEAWVTVTDLAEAEQAQAAGADVLIVQGSEAGGHRGSFRDPWSYGLLPLLALIGSRSSLPLVASGGIATGASLAATLCAGARAAQLGTAFMLCPEAGTSPIHRAALRSDSPTALTRAFTGRLARGIANQFMAEHEAAAPAAYPEVHYVTAPLRRHGREHGDPGLVNLWAGEAHALARELPAGDLVRQLQAEAAAAIASAAAHLERPPP